MFHFFGPGPVSINPQKCDYCAYQYEFLISALRSVCSQRAYAIGPLKVIATLQDEQPGHRAVFFACASTNLQLPFWHSQRNLIFVWRLLTDRILPRRNIDNFPNINSPPSMIILLIIKTGFLFSLIHFSFLKLVSKVSFIRYAVCRPYYKMCQCNFDSCNTLRCTS